MKVKLLLIQNRLLGGDQRNEAAYTSEGNEAPSKDG